MAVSYYISARLGLMIPFIGSYITLIWLPTGIAVALLLRWGYCVLPGIFIGAFATSYSMGAPLLVCASIALGNSLAPLSTAFILRRINFHNSLNRVQDILFLFAAAATGMLLSASGGVLTLVTFDKLPLQNAGMAWVSWWAGDFVGVLLASPILLNISLPKLKNLSRQLLEFFCWASVALGLSWVVFFLNHGHNHTLPLLFIISPLIVWSAMRFGLLGSSLGLLLPVILAAIATSNELGPFSYDTKYGLFLLWLFVLVLVLINLMVAALQAGQMHANFALQQSELKLRSIIETEPECVELLSKDSTILQINPAGLRLFGTDHPDKLIGQQALTLINPQHRQNFISLTNRIFEGESGQLEYEITGLNGEQRWMEIHAEPLRNEFRTIVSMLGIGRDITERKKIEEAQRIAAVAFETQDGIMISDANGNIMRVNQAFQNITGYNSEEVIGQNPRMFQSGRHDLAFYQDMWSCLTSTGKWKGEILDKRKNGEIYPKLMTITAVSDSNNQVTNYVAVFQDISNLKRSEQTIHQLAYFDPLTDLPNRRLLLDRLHQAQAVSSRSKKFGALLFLDLDHFKVINDTKGHAIGDQLLIQVAGRMQRCVREEDSVARLGGDEFVVLLEYLSNEESEAASQTELVAEKIRQKLSVPYTINEFECLCSVSIGISLFIGHNENAEDLLQHADVAMYHSKTGGRNAIRFFDPQMQAALDMRAGMEADLRHALEKNQFLLLYQIQVNNLRRPVGAEVLLRWNHPKRGVVSPMEFIPLAEETGLIVDIGLWVLKIACLQLAKWKDNPLTQNLTLAVNVSAKQFRHADFVAQIGEAIKLSGATPSQLKLELTESTVLENIEDTIIKMNQIKTYGVSFSMDDFGTGFSSLQYLKRLPLKQIKIDQSFVRDIATDPNDAAIVQTIIAMTEALGLDVIAEGVETEAQLEFIELRGCLTFQGYLFGMPVSIEQFEATLQATR